MHFFKVHKSFYLTYSWQDIRLDNAVSLGLEVEVEVAGTGSSFSDHQIGKDKCPKLPRSVYVFDCFEREFFWCFAAHLSNAVQAVFAILSCWL